MDLFESKNIKPMLIGAEGEPFDSPDYIYELKLDGVRCVAYLDSDRTELRNKRNMLLNAKFPELKEMHHQVKKRCILDGELFVMSEGKPSFFEVQRRTLSSKPFKIEREAARLPASFVAFDILYQDGRQLTDLPLMERKEILSKAIKESDQFAVSRYIETQGTELYKLAAAQELEGVVAKRKDSKYYMDKRTKDWIKIKNLHDDDYVICGYILKGNNVTSLVLGQYDGGRLIYQGHVTLGISSEDFKQILAAKRIAAPEFAPPKDNEDAVWLEPVLVGVVKYMEKTESGFLRQPIFKGLREDKAAKECIITKRDG